MMDWDDIKEAVAGAAPLLGGLFGGPAGAAVGGIVAAALGVDNTPDAIHSAVKSDPESAVKLAQIEADNRVQLQQLAVTAEANRLSAETARIQEEVKDRNSARDRDKAIINTGRHNYRADILAFLAVAGLISCVYFVAKDTGLEERAVNAIMFVAGVFASAVRDVFSFEFGSSRSSLEKTELLAKSPAVEVKR